MPCGSSFHNTQHKSWPGCVPSFLVLNSKGRFEFSSTSCQSPSLLVLCALCFSMLSPLFCYSHYAQTLALCTTAISPSWSPCSDFYSCQFSPAFPLREQCKNAIRVRVGFKSSFWKLRPLHVSCNTPIINPSLLPSSFSYFRDARQTPPTMCLNLTIPLRSHPNPVFSRKLWILLVLSSVFPLRPVTVHCYITCCCSVPGYFIIRGWVGSWWPVSQLWPRCLFRTTFELRMALKLKFFWGKKGYFIIHENYVKFTLQCPQTVFLEHSDTYSFMCCLWLSSDCNGRPGVSTETIRPTKSKIFPLWLLQMKLADL